MAGEARCIRCEIVISFDIPPSEIAYKYTNLMIYTAFN
jgi:hypothetical protein